MFLLYFFTLVAGNLTTNNCSDVTVHCLCGLPSNETIKTFLVSRKLHLDGGKPTCVYKSNFFEICAAQSCFFLSVASSVSNQSEGTIFGSSEISSNNVSQTKCVSCDQPQSDSLGVPKQDAEVLTEMELSSKHRKHYEVKHSFYPVKYVLFFDGNTDKSPSHGRFRRFPKKCNETLKSIKYAVVNCWFWPKYVTCNINCTPGHAMIENNKIISSTHRSCREPDSHWYPNTTFPVCQPLYHCTAYLTTPGNLACKSPTNGPPYCRIFCFPFNENDEVPEKQYDCVDENFEKTLPHCASLDKSGILLKSLPIVRYG